MASDKAPALTEGLRILELVSESKDSVSFETLLKNVNMSRSSVDRLLKTLVNSGYLFTGPGKRDGYSSGIRLLSMAFNTVKDLDFNGHIKRMMNSVSEKYQVSLQYAVYDRQSHKIIVQCKSESVDTLHVAGYGEDITACAHRHAIGKVILAFCPEEERKMLLKNVNPEKKTKSTIMPGTALDREFKKIQQKLAGWDKEESLPGIFRLALPVFAQNEKITGALGVSWINSPSNKVVAEVKNKLQDLVNFIGDHQRGEYHG